jgi:hypothetical protein
VKVCFNHKKCSNKVNVHYHKTSLYREMFYVLNSLSIVLKKFSIKSTTKILFKVWVAVLPTWAIYERTTTAESKHNKILIQNKYDFTNIICRLYWCGSTQLFIMFLIESNLFIVHFRQVGKHEHSFELFLLSCFSPSSVD